MHRAAESDPGRPLRIALVGAGEVTEHKHLRALREVRNATVASWNEAHMFDCLSWLYDGAQIPTK